MSELPFQIEIIPGSPAYEQVIHAVHKALASGLIKKGDAFPSVRALGKSARINPNTAHKVVQHLVQDGTLEVLPGRGTQIATPKKRSSSELSNMITPELEQLAIEAKRIGFTEKQLQQELSKIWTKLNL